MESTYNILDSVAMWSSSAESGSTSTSKDEAEAPNEPIGAAEDPTVPHFDGTESMTSPRSHLTSPEYPDLSGLDVSRN